MPHFSATIVSLPENRNFLHLPDKIENIAAFAATKAIENLFDGMHGEGRRFFLMEWAQAAEILAAFFQAHVFADHANDVRLLFYAIRE